VFYKVVKTPGNVTIRGGTKKKFSAIRRGGNRKVTDSRGKYSPRKKGGNS